MRGACEWINPVPLWVVKREGVSRDATARNQMRGSSLAHLIAGNPRRDVWLGSGVGA